MASHLLVLLSRPPAELLQEWIASLGDDGQAGRGDELRQQLASLLQALGAGVAGGSADLAAPAWSQARDLLTGFSASRATQGYTPSQTARVVFQLKQPLFAALRRALGRDPEALAEELWAATRLVDDLGLFTIEAFISAKEGIIRRQQEEMLELSTPVVKLWEGILALPLIGTLDSARTQVVMESMLQKVVETGSDVAIIDITGVPTVDTLVAQHLLKTVTAARLMGTDCIISGIRPQIAQTIVHLGVDLSGVITKASLADAFQIALQRRDLIITRRRQAAARTGAGDAPAA